MATPNNFYWVGGATSTSGSYTNRLGNFSGYTGTANMDWVLAFDWNNPRNWRILVPIFQGSTGGINGFTYADRCPAIGDNAIFGDYSAGVTGFNPGGIGPSVWTLPKAMAPCLWGGASANSTGITVTWVGGNDYGTNAVGTTYNSHLNQLIVRHFNDWFVAGATMQKYPFSYLGYGLGIANAAIGGSQNEYSPLYDASLRGFTLDLSIWGGASWESLVEAVVATAGSIEHLNQLRVKCPTIITAPEDPYGKYIGLNPNVVSASNSTVIYNKKNWGQIQLTNMKNLVQFGSGTTAGVFVNSVATIKGSANAYLSGYFYNITRDCFTPLSFTYSPFAPRETLLLQGVTANSVDCQGKVGSVYMSYNTNVGTMNVYPYDTFYNLDIQGIFLRESVLVDNGNYGQTAGSNTGGSPNLTVYTANNLGSTGSSTAPMPLGFPRRGVYIGSAGTVVKANEFQFGTEAPLMGATSWSSNHFYYGESSYGYGYPTMVNFQGNAQVNKVTSNRAFIGASPEIYPDANVELKELRMKNWSVLDMKRNTSFDNWKFGAQVGNSIVGGIIFDDENNMIRMSEGVALWNEQLIMGSNFVGGGGQVGKRNGNVTTSPGSFI